MNKQLELVKSARKALLNLVEDLSIDELNNIPAGFNNNIIWNMAHVIAAQENICYVRAGLPHNLEQKFFDAYKPGSKPDEELKESEIKHIKELFFTSIDQLAKDLESDIFSSYIPWTTRYGVEIQNIQDAISMLPFHEGIHLGYIMALKRQVKKPL